MIPFDFLLAEMAGAAIAIAGIHAEDKRIRRKRFEEIAGGKYHGNPSGLLFGAAARGGWLWWLWHSHLHNIRRHHVRIETGVINEREVAWYECVGCGEVEAISDITPLVQDAINSQKSDPWGHYGRPRRGRHVSCESPWVHDCPDSTFSGSCLASTTHFWQAAGIAIERGVELIFASSHVHEEDIAVDPRVPWILPSTYTFDGFVHTCEAQRPPSIGMSLE